MTNDTKSASQILVLISGSGSNLQSIINSCNSGEIRGKVVAVISNVPDVKGLERAAKAKIPNMVVNHQSYSSRSEFDDQLCKIINRFNPDLVVLAGFMRILSKDFVKKFEHKMINIHPSLLPAYPGLNTHQRAIDSGDREAGATVHYVTSELDGGPCILRAKVSVHLEDTAADLAKRVLEREHIIFPKVVEWFCDRRITLNNGVVFIDGVSVPKAGLLFEDSSEH